MKLEACADVGHFNLLQQMPGVQSRDSQKRAEENGWYVPVSLIDMGRRGGELSDYAPDPNITMPNGLKLREYQARAVTFLRQVTPDREGAILAADMGLRKTATALHALWLDGYLNRCGLVVGPPVAQETWCDPDGDARAFFGLEIVPLEGMKNIAPEILQHHKWFFCHYGILKAWYSWLFAVLKPASVIFDESHNLQHPNTQRFEASRNISMCGSIERRYCLTGTPIGNRRLELWCQLAVAQPRQWGGGQFQFGVRYCAGSRQSEEEGGHWQYEGESNDFELGARLAGTLLRYTRYDQDVAAQLPPMKRHAVVAENLDEGLLQQYHAARVNVVKYLQDRGELSKKTEKFTIAGQTIELSANDQKPGAVRLICLTQLISILSKLKQAPALAEVIRILGHHNRLVVFTWRIDTAAWLFEKLSGIAKTTKIAGKTVQVFGPVDGEMPRHRRRELAKLFAQAPAAIYVATRGAAGVAINDLVSASACLMVDLYWNTTTLLQAESRVHRDSGVQTQDVDVYYLVVRNTIDDFMLEKLQTKASAIRSIAPRDTMGMHLVRDLSPMNLSEDGPDMDALCSALMAA